MNILGLTAAGMSQYRVRGVPLTLAPVAFLSLLPTLEIHSSGKRCQHDELRERDAGPLRELRSRIERIWLIRRQAENE